MSSTSNNLYQPDYCVSPGEILLESLEERGLTQSDLAQRMRRPIKTINEIVQGKTSITPDTALQLERVLDIPSKFWLNLEANYQTFVARELDRERLEKWTGWLDEIPVTSMVKEGWIDEDRDPVTQLQAVLCFYGIASPEVWNDQWLSSKVTNKTSQTYPGEPGAVSAWLRRGEILGQRIMCSPFDGKTFRHSIVKLRNLTLKSPAEFQVEITKVCSLCGVAVVFVPKLPKAQISGATRWLTPQKALIQISLRHETDDRFWFTFFHEAAHILLHGKREFFIDDEPNDLNLREHEANVFASDLLLPPKQLSRFIANQKFDKKSVVSFSEDIGIAPGIIVAKLQRQKLIKKDQLNDLKKSLVFGEV